MTNLVFDAKDALVGRLAAKTAKSLLTGMDVTIVNAELALFSGNPDFVVNKYYQRREMTDKSNPEQAAKWPRRPDLFLKRVIRGMLPKRHVRKKDALARLRVYLGSPSDVKDAQNMSSPKMPHRVISVGQVCQRLGWNGALPLTKTGS